jgi:hypothetical protein
MDYIIARGLVVVFEIILMDFDSFEPILTFRGSAVALLVILSIKMPPKNFRLVSKTSRMNCAN